MKYLLAVLVDEDKMVDDDDRPLISASAALGYVAGTLRREGARAIEVVKVLEDGEVAFAALGGPEERI